MQYGVQSEPINFTRWDDLPAHLRRLNESLRQSAAQSGVRPDAQGSSAWSEGWSWLDSLIAEIRGRPVVRDAFYPHISRASLWLTRDSQVTGDEGIYCDPVAPGKFRVSQVRRAPRTLFWPSTETEIVFEGDACGAADCLEQIAKRTN